MLRRMKLDGIQIRQAREAQKPRLSRERLAARIGVSSDTIVRIEEGSQPGVAAGTVFLVARELGLDLESLFIEDGEAVA